MSPFPLQGSLGTWLEATSTYPMATLVRKAKYLGQKCTEMSTCFRNKSYSLGFLDLGRGQHLMLKVAVLLGRASSTSLLLHSFGNAVHMWVTQHQILSPFSCARKEEQRAGGAWPQLLCSKCTLPCAMGLTKHCLISSVEKASPRC